MLRKRRYADSFKEGDVKDDPGKQLPVGGDKSHGGNGSLHVIQGCQTAS